MSWNSLPRFAALGIVLASSFLASAQQWIGLATPHFRLYTTNGDKAASDALESFERARYFFANSGIFKSVPGNVVQIVAFSSEQEYSAHHINPGASGYYQRTQRGDYIVMRDLNPDHYQVVVHEYTHFVFEHTGLKLPLWLNEGLADVYSSIATHQGQVVLGRPPLGRLYTLQRQPWIDLATLLAVNQDSPYYSQSDKMLLFYAQSWALTHMLALSQDYAAKFPLFLESVSEGMDARESLVRVYHKTLAQIGDELHEYMQRKQLPMHAFDMDLTAAETEPRQLASPREQVDLALADLAASNPYADASGGAAQLSSVSMRYPDSPEAEESLGYLSLRQNNMEEARQHFAKAVERHSHTPEVVYYLAHLESNAGASPDRVIDLLNRALELKPGYYEARLELGLVAAKANKFEIAVNALTAARADAHPEHSYLISYTLAYCYAQLHQSNEALQFAKIAQHAARSTQDQEQTNNLLRYLERQRELTANR